MQEVLGNSLSVFIALTLVVMGFSAFMTGVGLAATWRPMWQAFPYCILLGLTDRFLAWSLFGGELLLLSGYLIDTTVLILICLFAYRATQARKMVTQYPWLYERSGILNWRSK